MDSEMTCLGAVVASEYRRLGKGKSPRKKARHDDQDHMPAISQADVDRAYGPLLEGFPKLGVRVTPGRGKGLFVKKDASGGGVKEGDVILTGNVCADANWSIGSRLTDLTRDVYTVNLLVRGLSCLGSRRDVSDHYAERMLKCHFVLVTSQTLLPSSHEPTISARADDREHAWGPLAYQPRTPALPPYMHTFMPTSTRSHTHNMTTPYRAPTHSPVSYTHLTLTTIA